MFADAQKNPSLLQVFINTALGETWVVQGEAPEWQRLYDRRDDYKIEGAGPRQCQVDRVAFAIHVTGIAVDLI